MVVCCVFSAWTLWLDCHAFDMNERLLLVCFVGTVGNKNHSKVQAKQKQSRLLWPDTRQLDVLPQLHDHTEMKFSDYLAHLTGLQWHIFCLRQLIKVIKVVCDTYRCSAEQRFRGTVMTSEDCVDCLSSMQMISQPWGLDLQVLRPVSWAGNPLTQSVHLHFTSTVHPLCFCCIHKRIVSLENVLPSETWAIKISLFI